LFPKLRRDNVLKNADETKSHRAHRSRTKAETFETLEIFQDRGESKAQEEERQQPLDQLQRKRSGMLNLTPRHSEERMVEDQI
jgi:hypothetical protein